jgi:ribonuclease D
MEEKGNQGPELHITKEAVNELPLLRYEGPVTVVQDEAAAGAALLALGRETLLGFDIEARPAFRKGASYPPALLQLAGSGAVWLFQLRRPECLKEVWKILESAVIVKAGVSVADDLRKLRELREFAPAGFVDVAEVSTELGIRNNGLRGLAAALLGGRISKGARTSDWSKEKLSPAQVSYAATDAWASREIYLRLAALRAASKGPVGGS